MNHRCYTFLLLFLSSICCAAAHEITQVICASGVQAIKGGIGGVHDTLLYAGMPLLAVRTVTSPSAIMPGCVVGGCVLAAVPVVQLVQKGATHYSLSRNIAQDQWAGYSSRADAERDTNIQAFGNVVGRLAAIGGTSFALYKGISYIPQEHLRYWTIATQCAGMGLLLFESTDFFKSIMQTLEQCA